MNALPLDIRQAKTLSGNCSACQYDLCEPQPELFGSHGVEAPGAVCCGPRGLKKSTDFNSKKSTIPYQ